MSATDKHSTLSVLTIEADLAGAGDVSEHIRDLLKREPVELSRPGCERVWLEIYFNNANEAILAGELLKSRFPDHEMSIRPCRSRDWTIYWRHHFKPVKIGKRLLVCPVWDSERVRDGERLVVLINPGLSFGTGDHFTTRFCLEMIDLLGEGRAPESFLDVGCGSGILAIAAALLGVKRVAGIDNDEQCISQSAKNAGLNGVGERIEWITDSIENGSGRLQSGRPTTGSFDVVCANLYASLLVDIAPVLYRFSSRYLILSGIRDIETDAVSEAYVQLGAREITRDCDGEWSGLLLDVSPHDKTF